MAHAAAERRSKSLVLKVHKEAVAAAAWFTLSCGGERSEAAAVAGIGPTRRRRKEALEVGGSAIDGLEAMNHECTTKRRSMQKPESEVGC